MIDGLNFAICIKYVSTTNQSMILVDDIEQGEAEQILNILISKTGCGDKMLWGPIKSGAFTVRSAWRLLSCGLHVKEEGEDGRSVLKW